MKRFWLVILCIYCVGNAAQTTAQTAAPASTPAPANFSLMEEQEKQAIANGKAGIVINIGRSGGRGKARNDYDCKVQPLPSAIRSSMNLHRFYRKYAHAYGIPIISSNRVSDAAITRACYVVRFALADRQDVREWLYDRYGRAGVIAERERTTDIPEHSYLPNWWNQRARGLGATLHKPISTAGEENLLCRRSDRYYGGGNGEDIFLHEFAHAIHNLGVTGAIPNFDRRIRDLYNRRRRDGRWARTYFMSTDREFFAEGVTSYFDVNTETRDGRPNGIHNHVNTRQELKVHDLELYNLVKEVFPCGNKFLDRCSALRGKSPPPFRMNCKNGGGTVVTDKPPTPPVPTPPVPTPPVPTPPKPNTPPLPTPPVPTPPKPNTPPLPTPPVPTPPKPNTPPVPTPPKPSTPPKPNTPPVPTPPKPSTPPKPNTPPVPTPPKASTPPKPNTPPVPTPPKPSTPPKPNTPPVPTPPKPSTPPKPNTPPVPTPPKPNTPPLPTPPVPTPPLPTPPLPTPPLPSPPLPTTKKTTRRPRPSNCYNYNRHCKSWASNGQCARNPGYMKIYCCKSCRGSTTRNCRDNNYSCPSWASRRQCRLNPRYMLTYCKKSCNRC